MNDRCALPRCVRRSLVALLALALCASCSSEAGMPGTPVDGDAVARSPHSTPPTELTVTDTRRSPGVVVSGGSAAPYGYGPTVIREGGRYRAWWCSQLPGVGPAGDDILHAASRDLDSRFTAAGGAPAVPVFHGSPGGFDAMHTCDPSVIRVDGRYYMYYTGAAGDHAHGNSIGVASSSDGIHWRREAGGAPIVTPSHEVNRPNVYGAGQPSALYLDGWFYLMFTDTTASGAGWNGAGQFVLRAGDAEFSEQVQALTASGFEPVPGTGADRPRSIVDAFSADWMWVEALQAFAVAHQTQQGTRITFWDRGFTRHPYRPVVVVGPWQEGPGLVRQPDGHAVVPPSDPCGTIPIDVLRATALGPAPSRIRHFGVDVLDARGCRETERARAVLDGFAMPSPRRTVDVVHDGVKVRIERRSVAEHLARRVLPERVPALDSLPVVARIPSEARALRSPEGELALLDTRGRRWFVGGAAVRANDAAVRDVGVRKWRSHPFGGDLRLGHRT